MRPPAIERMGYYPTDDPVVEFIRTYKKPPTEIGRLFDPCAGEGRAAASLGKALNCETWGVELSPCECNIHAQSDNPHPHNAGSYLVVVNLFPHSLARYFQIQVK